MNARLPLTLVLLSCISASVAASDFRQKWWESDRVKTHIGLTSAQSGEIEQIFQTVLPRMRAEKEELDRQQQVLSRLMDSPAATESEVSSMVDRVEAARAKANKTRLLMLYRMHQVLSPKQREKLDELHSKRSSGSRMRSSLRPSDASPRSDSAPPPIE